MAVVRIPDDIYERINEIAVTATIAQGAPVKQGVIIAMLLRMQLAEFSKREIANQILDHMKTRTLKDH